MEKNEFSKLESMCQCQFVDTGSCFHVCSGENHPVTFHNEEEFITAMNAVAFVAFMFSDIRIFTFEIMSNHFHFALSGLEERISLFTRNLVSKLASMPELSASSNDIRKLSFKSYRIESLDNLRNVIAYINKNGAVVDPNESVFTYRWGANRFFFNREVRLRFEECGKKTTFRKRRELFHSEIFSNDENIVILDGVVSPLCYCKIDKAQSFFRNNRHYFYSISRNIESSLDIARTIGENLFYSDEDLFVHIMAKCSKNYGCKTVGTLAREAKMELARELHFDFNAGNKQISRLLKMDLSVVTALFPSK